MQISIQADNLLFAIQSRFQELYPYLKLEFLHTAPAIAPLQPAGLATGQQLINVHPEKPVMQLEEELKGICGVNVHVLRKCGQRRHERVSARHATLAHQNKEGRLRTALARVPDVY